MPNIDADNGDFSLPTIPEYVQGGLPSGLTNSSHVFGDILHLQPRHGQFRSNHRFLGGSYQGWFRLAADAGNLLEEVDEIVIRVCPRGDTSAVEVCKALCAASRPTAWALTVLWLGPVLQPVPLTFSCAIMVMLVAIRIVVSSLSSMPENRCQL